jgi:hypothetical protein
VTIGHRQARKTRLGGRKMTNSEVESAKGGVEGRRPRTRREVTRKVSRTGREVERWRNIKQQQQTPTTKMTHQDHAYKLHHHSHHLYQFPTTPNNETMMTTWS